MGVTLMEIELEAPIDPIPGVRLPCLGEFQLGFLSVHSAQAGHSEHKTLHQAGGGGENRRGPRTPAAAGLARETGWAFVRVFK